MAFQLSIRWHKSEESKKYFRSLGENRKRKLVEIREEEEEQIDDAEPPQVQKHIAEGFSRKIC